jgi:hypothetical protein
VALAAAPAISRLGRSNSIQSNACPHAPLNLQQLGMGPLKQVAPVLLLLLRLQLRADHHRVHCRRHRTCHPVLMACCSRGSTVADTRA